MYCPAPAVGIFALADSYLRTLRCYFGLGLRRTIRAHLKPAPPILEFTSAGWPGARALPKTRIADQCRPLRNTFRATILDADAAAKLLSD